MISKMKNLAAIARDMFERGEDESAIFEYLWMNSDSMAPWEICPLLPISAKEGQRLLDDIVRKFRRIHGPVDGAAHMFAKKANNVFMVHGEWPTWATDGSLGFTCRKNTPEDSAFVRKHIEAFAKDRKRRAH